MVYRSVLYFLCAKQRMFYPLLFYLLWGCVTIKDHQINEEIRDKEVRLIDDAGNQLGVVSINQALELAETKKLDLVNVAPTAKPIVCRIMDYGKFKYELMKKEKEARKKQNAVDRKSVV